ncbi:MAG: class I SAM-dependent methyltransferase [Chloroflexota bacterium]
MIKSQVKTILPTPVAKVLGRGLHNLRHLRYLLKRSLNNSSARAKSSYSLRQSVETVHSNIELGTGKELEAIFANKGFPIDLGEYVVYLHETSCIQAINPDFEQLYPHPFGLKFFKSSDISPDGTPYYTSPKISSAATAVTMRAVGSIQDKMRISNILSLRGVAPRVYDIVKFESGDVVVFAQVVQHIDGAIVTGEVGSAFIDKFQAILAEEGISRLGSKQHIDFAPPDFNRNIVADDTGAYYVDIQNFEILDQDARFRQLAEKIQDVTHFGQGRPLRGQRYSYQSIPGLATPGKRDTLYRISKIDGLLKAHQVDFRNCNVLDVGCNLGTLLMYALSEGAKWGIGLDMPAIAQVSKQYLLESGFSRIDVLGCDLCEDKVASFLPISKFDFVFYMSIENHIGFPSWLNELSIDLMLYEGHQNESVDEITDKIKRWSPNAEILDSMMMQDGDSLPRPILLARIT